MKEQFVNVVVDKLERGLSEVAGVAGTARSQAAVQRALEMRCRSMWRRE